MLGLTQQTEFISAISSHSENKIIVQSELCETEIVPGMLQSSVQKACVLQERQRHKPKATDYISILSFFSWNFFEECLLYARHHARLKHSRSNFVFDIRQDFIFGMLYLDVHKRILLLLGGLAVPFDNETNILINRCISSAVGKVNKLRKESLCKLKTLWFANQ